MYVVELNGGIQMNVNVFTTFTLYQQKNELVTFSMNPLNNYNAFVLV